MFEALGSNPMLIGNSKQKTQWTNRIAAKEDKYLLLEILISF